MVNYTPVSEPARNLKARCYTTGIKIRIRPGSFGLCAVPGISRSRLCCFAGLPSYAKRIFPGRASCGPFSKIFM